MVTFLGRAAGSPLLCSTFNHAVRGETRRAEPAAHRVRLKCCSFQELNQTRSSLPKVNLTRPKGRLNVSIQIFPSWSACLAQGASGIMRRFSRRGRKSPAGKHSNYPQSSATASTTNRAPDPPTKSFPSGNKRLHEPDSSIEE